MEMEGGADRIELAHYFTVLGKVFTVKIADRNGLDPLLTRTVVGMFTIGR